jgi:regulation of enolase protein 1 (concanavalin A-like superfamily)
MWMGLFDAHVFLKVSDSIIPGNTVDYFLHKRSDWSLGPRNYHLESFLLRINGTGNAVTIDCLMDGTELEVVPTWISQTAIFDLRPSS